MGTLKHSMNEDWWAAWAERSGVKQIINKKMVGSKIVVHVTTSRQFGFLLNHLKDKGLNRSPNSASFFETYGSQTCVSVENGYSVLDLQTATEKKYKILSFEEFCYLLDLKFIAIPEKETINIFESEVKKYRATANYDNKSIELESGAISVHLKFGSIDKMHELIHKYDNK